MSAGAGPAVLDHLVVFLVALGTTVAATPPVRALARRLGAVDQPEERRVHAAPTPTMGGLALLAGVLAAIGAGAVLPGFDEVFATTSEPEAVVLAAVVIAGVGAVDDLRGMSAPVKLAGQLLAAGMLVLFGMSMLFIWIPGNPGSIVSLTPDLGALFTIAAIVAMINAVNLVDGLDGLAAGIVAIASVALFCYVQYSGDSTVSLTTSAPLLLAALAGACVGFLFYNFNPASIFMGDTGAMLLGLLLGAAGVSAVGGTVSPGRGDFAALSVPVLVPVLVLAVPFFDTAWAVLRRLASRRAVFAADKQHLHHRLVDIGHSHRRAVLIMYLWSALVAFAAAGIGILTSPLAQRAIVAGVALVTVVAVAVRVRTLTGRPPGPVSRGRGRARAG